MKLILFVACFLSFHAFSQQFRVAPDFYDSLSLTQYAIHLNGQAVFSDSMTIRVELRSLQDSTLVFSGEHAFAQPAESTLPGLAYDATAGQFTLALGTYPTTNYSIFLQSIIAEEVNEEIFILDLHLLNQ
jgi:hypothetical protein